MICVTGHNIFNAYIPIFPIYVFQTGNYPRNYHKTAWHAMTLIKKSIGKSLNVYTMGPLTVLISQNKMILKQQNFDMTKTILIDTRENNGLNHFFKYNQKCPQSCTKLSLARGKCDRTSD